MAVLGLVFQLLLTYAILGNILALFLLKLLQKVPIDRRGVLFASLGLAPGIISLILFLSFLLLPGASHFVYIGIVLAVFLIILVLSWRGFPLLLETYKSLFCKPRYLSLLVVLRMALTIVVLGAILFVSYLAILFPIQATDAMRHATVGRVLFEDCSLEHFPPTSLSEHGHYYGVSYPPGLHLLYAWSYLLQGSTASDIGVRIVAPMYVVFTLLLVWRWGEALGKGVGLFAMFALATMPIYMHQAAGNSIDAMRMFFFFSSLYWVWQLIESRSPPLIGIAIVALSLGPFVHAFGVFVLPVAGALYCLFARERIMRRIGIAALVVLPVGVLGGLAYVRQFGTIDILWRPLSSLAFKVSSILAGLWLAPMSYVSESGVSQVFTQYQTYGILPWLFLASLLLLSWKRHRENRSFIFVILCSILTMTLIYAYLLTCNYSRYNMTVAPFVALCVGLFLNDLGYLSNSPIKQTVMTLAKRRRYEV